MLTVFPNLFDNTSVCYYRDNQGFSLQWKGNNFTAQIRENCQILQQRFILQRQKLILMIQYQQQDRNIWAKYQLDSPNQIISTYSPTAPDNLGAARIF